MVFHQYPSSCLRKKRQSRKRIWLPQLSSLANLLLMRCSRILSISVEEMRRRFEREALPFLARGADKDHVLNLLEYCCFETLAMAWKRTGYLKDEYFRRLSFDMMLAWEDPHSVASSRKEHYTGGECKQKEDDDLYYSALIPLLVRLKSTVGKRAFVRITSAMPGVTDVLNAHSHFDLLVLSTGGRLTFHVYNNYLIELDKILDSFKHQQALHKYPYLKGEIILEMDGFHRSEPVVLRIGPSSFTGRLLLTDHSLYFESATYFQKFDLANAVKEEMKPCGNGPCGYPLFNRAFVYSSGASDQDIVVEFPEFLGCSRRDYWLIIIREVICTHSFVRENCLEGPGQIEAISRSILGIMRFKAMKKAVCANPLELRSLLCFYTPHALACGDLLHNFLGNKLKRGELQPLRDRREQRGFPHIESAVSVLCNLEGCHSSNENDLDASYIHIGELFPEDFQYIDSIFDGPWKAITQIECSDIVVPGEMVDRLSINVAIMKAFFKALQPSMTWIKDLLSWEDPLRIILVILLGSFIILRDLLHYVFVLCFLGAAMFLIFFKQDECGSLPGEIWISSPGMDAVGEVVELKQVLDKFECLLKIINRTLLRIHGLFYSLDSQATDQFVVFLMILAGVIAVLPAKVILVFFFWEISTRELPLRKEVTKGCMKRFRRWWVHIPVAPIQRKSIVRPKKYVDKEQVN